MSSRFATLGQIEFALKLGAIESESQGRQMTKKTISRLIESAKQNHYQELCRIYNELDAELQRSGDILDLAQKATTLKKQGYSHWYCGPCPECGGEDRFYINIKDNLFKCGHAGGYGNGCGWGGGIAQMAAYIWKCSTWDAIDSLTGQSPRSEPVKMRKSQVDCQQTETKEEKLYHDFLPIWKASLEHLREPSGQAGRDFLAQRGITEDVWLANHVGFMEDYKRGPTVCFPHQLDVNGTRGQVVSLNRRFLDDENRLVKIKRAKEAGKKIDMPKTKHVNGGRWGLYHLASVSGAHTLIVIEGEINGLSVWLVVRHCGWLIDVVSIGSEGAFKTLAPHISELAKEYRTIIIWADKFEVAEQATKMIEHHNITAIRSPVFRGKELDANNFLLRGALEDFLKRVLPNQETLHQSDTLNHLANENGNHQPATHSSGESNGHRQALNGHTLNHLANNESPIKATNQIDSDDEKALWAKYANDSETEPFSAARIVTVNAWWADLAFPPPPPVPVRALTARDELLYLCSSLCDKIYENDKEKGLRWYLVCALYARRLHVSV